jgi:hypothetical protein
MGDVMRLHQYRGLAPIERPAATKQFLRTIGAGLALALAFSTGWLGSSAVFAQSPIADEAIPSPERIAELQAEQSAPRTAITIDPAILDGYVGYYELWPNKVFTVTRDGPNFFVRLTGQGPVAWLPESQTKFFARVVRAQISFVTDSRGSATELVLHQGGFEQHAKRISEAAAKAIEAARELRIATNAQAPGTQASLRRFIDSLERGQPNYEEMTTPLAATVRQEWTQTGPKIKQMGALKSITFRTVSPQDMDVYDVQFDHAKVEWGIAPLTDDGKVISRYWRELP